MAINKMLIDASHPEETRVVMVRGNRIEELDFESQHKRQLRGNIYLAKVTRVEPSLQAAFVDYGGNRHGFLAFSEIHPDYYQIPMADRKALLEEEAAYEKNAGEEEESELEEKPAKRRSRRKSKKASDEAVDTQAAKDDDASSEGTEESADAANSDDDSTSDSKEETEIVEVASEEKSDEPEAAEEAPSDDAAEENGNDDASDEADPKSIAAMMETDSISEAVGDESSSDDNDSGDGEEEAVSATPGRRPRRKATSRPGKKKAAEEVEAAPEPTEETAAEPVAEKAPRKRKAATKKKVTAEVSKDASEEDVAQAVSQDAVTEDAATEEAGEEKPAKSNRRRRSSRGRGKSDKDAAAKADENGDDGEANGDDEDSVESIGESEDTMEEVARPRKMRRQYKIQEVIKRRQVLLVQVVKEERGNKGAALTTYLSLAGRYSVLMPNTARGGGISRKITNAPDRKRLKAIAGDLEVPAGMGVILRTAGASRSKEEIQRDFEYLMRLWQNVRNLTLSSSAPCLVYEEGSLIKRSIRDLYDNKNTGEVLVAGEEGFREARDFMEMLMPTHTKNVKYFQDEQSLFARFGIDQQLDKMLTPQVTMKSGGYLVINQTEALVAIDVNSGRSTREHSIEDTALQTNLEAAEEVSRQLRLRDLAGLIVIDFIDMEERRNNRAVEKRLKDCLKHDRARIQVGRISHFGLMEMSRQRMRASVLDSTMEICPHCNGNGYLRAPSTVALQLFRSIEEHLLRNHKFDAIVKVQSDVALYMLNHKRQSLLDLESRFGLKIIIEASYELLGGNFEIVKGEPASGERTLVNHIQPDFIDADAIVSDVTVEEDEEKPANNKRKRRRRGRNSDATADTDSEPNEESSEANASPSEASEDEEEGKSRSRRRRGKRGGRRNRSAKSDDEGNSENADGEVKEVAAQAETSEATSQSEEVSQTADAVEEAPTEKPKRSRRPRKAKAADDVPAPVEAKDEVETSPEVVVAADESEAPARATRRTTRRKAAPKADAGDAGESGDGASEIAHSAESETDNKVTEEATKPKKKGSWWSGNGFFS